MSWFEQCETYHLKYVQMRKKHTVSRRIAAIARQLRTSGAALPTIGPKMIQTVGSDMGTRKDHRIEQVVIFGVHSGDKLLN